MHTTHAQTNGHHHPQYDWHEPISPDVSDVKPRAARAKPRSATERHPDELSAGDFYSHGKATACTQRRLSPRSDLTTSAKALAVELASHYNPNGPKYRVFPSYNCIGERLSWDNSRISRAMKELTKHRLIKTLKKRSRSGRVRNEYKLLWLRGPYGLSASL